MNMNPCAGTNAESAFVYCGAKRTTSSFGIERPMPYCASLEARRGSTACTSDARHHTPVTVLQHTVNKMEAEV